MKTFFIIYSFFVPEDRLQGFLSRDKLIRKVLKTSILKLRLLMRV